MSQMEQFIQNSIPIPNRTYPINKLNVEKKKKLINDIDISEEVIDNFCSKFTITPWANKEQIDKKNIEIQNFIDNLKKELPEKIDELEIILKTGKTDESAHIRLSLLVTELKKFLKHNENSTIKKLENLKKNSILEIIDEIIINTTHINFSTFIKELNFCIKEFEDFVSKSLTQKFNSFILYIPNPPDSATNSFTKTNIEKKSNYWVSQIVYNMLKEKPTEIIFDNNEFKKSEKELNIILCDDGVFTGMQFYETIYNLRQKYTDKLNLHLIIPYMSEIGRDNILQHTRITFVHSKTPPSIYFYTTQNIKSFGFPSYKTPLSSPGNKYLFYFDHKLPDSITTIDMFFKFAYIDDKIINNILIGKSKLEDSEFKYPESKKIPLISNCSIEDINDCKKCYTDKNCPVNPYKIRENTEDVKVLSPYEFKEYINTIITEKKSDGKSKRRQSSKKQQRKSKKQQSSKKQQRKSKKQQSSKKQQRKSKRRQSSKKQQRKSKRRQSSKKQQRKSKRINK
jgi:hypothetical protein